MKQTKVRSLLLAMGLCVLFALSGCKDGSRDTDSADGATRSVQSGSTNSGDTADQAIDLAEQYFQRAVQPNLDFCRTCHVADGLADLVTQNDDQPNRFVLSPEKDFDYRLLRAGWTAMGGGVADSLLLLESSDPAQAHSGGQPWPPESQPYLAMQSLLACWKDAEKCDFADGMQQAPAVHSLLGSRHARSIVDEFCEDQSDDALLPEDPRSLIQPGVNAGRAVAFNAYWQDCTAASSNPFQRPATCGEYRSRIEIGRTLMQTGLSMKFGHWFSTAAHYDRMWRRWGLRHRPDNFDELVRARYGLPVAPYRNPYPLPGEDPQLTDGGSGQLPLGLTQIRDNTGRYTGNVSISCEICHGGNIDALYTEGDTYVAGLGANTVDMQLLITDLLIPLPIGLNQSRGATNAMGLSGLLISLLDPDSMGAYIGNVIPMQFPGNTRGSGDNKMPPLWNASHRPRKFWDGGLSYDAARLDSAILNVSAAIMRPLGNDKAYNKRLRDKVEMDSLNIQAYVDSLTSPAYPFAIDTALAEQGAVLFHSKDLWASGTNADIPRPPTNGSCAGCHGAYSPRYVNDPDFLEDPRLEGMAGYISALVQIRTDAERVKSFTRPLLELMSTSWFSYPEGSPGYTDPDSKTVRDEMRDNLGIFRPGTRVKGACTWQGAEPGDARGYLAPPLYGVWASAPYLHNGSVPDLWTLLTPNARPAIWRRLPGDPVGNEDSYDTRAGAYDEERMGWKYDELLCDEESAGVPFSTCEPVDPNPSQAAWNNFWRQAWGRINTLGYQVIQPLHRKAIERRKIFNTHDYGKSNAGHDFTRTLTDSEKRALIEYLKTL